MTANANGGERRRAAAQMHALAAVRREIGSRDRASGRKYLREFSRAFQNYEETLTPAQLDGRIGAADIVLIGDYHALAASQRFAAGVIERVARERRVVVGLEALLSRDQPVVDSWWRREIVEDDLRQRLRFEQHWGYDWTPFFEILVAARDHGEGLFGLDCLPRDDFRQIRSRDRHAAAKIAELRERHADACIVVLIGESHLAPQHLPAILAKTLPGQRLLTVLQNVDALYWKAVEEEATAVSVSQDTVCVFNATPLEKYESYRLCIEKWNGDEQPDFAPAVYNVIFSLARTLGFRLHSPHNRTQPRYLADALPQVIAFETEHAEEEAQHLSCAGAPLPLSSGQIRQLIEEHGCLYVAETNAFFVREFQSVRVAAEAARFLYRACSGGSPPDLERERTLAHFGSRLLCPQALFADASVETRGEALYQAYVDGRITKAEIRQMFLSNGPRRRK